MNVPGFSLHEELEYLVGAGLSPLEALRTGTVNVAKFFGDDEAGSLSVGDRADLVLLGANPLENISHTRQILGVMRGGRWFNRPALDAALAEVRSRGI